MISHTQSSQSGILMYPVLFVLILILGIGVGIASLLTGELKSQRGLPAASEALSAAEVGIERMERIDGCVAIPDEGDRFDCLEEYAGATNDLFKDWECDKKKLDPGKCLEGAIEHISGGTLGSGATYALEVKEEDEDDCDEPVCFYATGTFENIVRKIELKRTTASLLPCGDDLDVILVLDNSGSINNSERAQLRTAAKAFVGALFSSGSDTEVGIVTFNMYGVLNSPLSDDEDAVTDAIGLAIPNLPVVTGTNLEDGLFESREELSSSDDDRPDYFILISDGRPTAYGLPSDPIPPPPYPPTPSDPWNPVPGVTDCGTSNAGYCLEAADAAGEAMATAAKADEITIFGVGVGTGGPTSPLATYLKDRIVTPDPKGKDGYYFDVADYGALAGRLEDLCGAGPEIFF